MADQDSAPRIEERPGSGPRSGPSPGPTVGGTPAAMARRSDALWLAGATALLGASGYVFLTLTAGLVPATDYAALASLYLLVAFINPGLFLAVEQETTRLGSRWQALDRGPRELLVQIGQLTAAVLAVALVLLLVMEPVLVDRVFNGHTSLWLALVACVVAYAAASLTRGIFAGQRRVRAYAAGISVEGVVRLFPCLVLAAAGVSAVVPYGVVFAAGTVCALAATVPLVRLGDSGPRVPWRELIPATGWLMAAWTLFFALANIAPVIVNALLPDEPVRAGAFAFAFVLTRVPLFILYAFQAILLPALSRAAARRDVPALRLAVRQGMIAVGAMGVLALVATAPLAGWLIGVLFGPSGRLSAVTLTLLAVGTIMAMVVQILQPALIAVAGHRIVAAGWLVGTALFGAAFALPLDPVAAATVAQIAAGASTAVVLGLALRRHLRLPPANDASLEATA